MWWDGKGGTPLPLEEYHPKQVSEDLSHFRFVYTAAFRRLASSGFLPNQGDQVPRHDKKVCSQPLAANRRSPGLIPSRSHVSCLACSLRAHGAVPLQANSPNTRTTSERHSGAQRRDGKEPCITD